MEMTPDGARALGQNILQQLHGSAGSIQIWNHFLGELNKTDMHFAAPQAYGLAWNLLIAAGDH